MNNPARLLAKARKGSPLAATYDLTVLLNISTRGKIFSRSAGECEQSINDEVIGVIITPASVLPFVPFRTSVSDTSHHGWFKVIDTTITLAIYRKLDNDWRWEDTLENGYPAHNWHFKQLHIMLTGMPVPMANTIRATSQSPEWTS